MHDLRSPLFSSPLPQLAHILSGVDMMERVWYGEVFGYVRLMLICPPVFIILSVATRIINRKSVIYVVTIYWRMSTAIAIYVARVDYDGLA